jgi:hypothetical protein
MRNKTTPTLSQRERELQLAQQRIETLDALVDTASRFIDNAVELLRNVRPPSTRLYDMIEWGEEILEQARGPHD